MLNWKRNLAAVWGSQFLSLMAFGMSLTFIPYYIQDLGVEDAWHMTLWTNILAAAGFAAMAVMSPVWGMLADRYGHKLMLMRANGASIGILILMGFAPNVWVLLVLRLMQGALTGTVTAARALVSTTAPEDKQGSAIGSLSTSVFVGNLAGVVAGGLMADAYGYRATFLYGAGLMVVSLGIVVAWVRDAHSREETEARRAAERAGAVGSVAAVWRARLALLMPTMPLMGLVLAVAVARMYEQPQFPLLVQLLNGGEVQGAAWMTGAVTGLAAVGAVISGLVMGKLSDRMNPGLLAIGSVLGTAVFMGLLSMVTSFGALIPLRFLMLLCLAGLDPMLQAWIAKVTPRERRGTMMGLAVSARSIGWTIGPLWAVAVAGLAPPVVTSAEVLAASAPDLSDVRTVYRIGPLLYLALVPLIMLAMRAVARGLPLAALGAAGAAGAAASDGEAGAASPSTTLGEPGAGPDLAEGDLAEMDR